MMIFEGVAITGRIRLGFGIRRYDDEDEEALTEKATATLSSLYALLPFDQVYKSTIGCIGNDPRL